MPVNVFVCVWLSFASAALVNDDDGGRAAVTNEADHWSFKPVRVAKIPATVDPFIANPIDAFILAKLGEHRLQPSPPADRRTIIRRFYADLIGLPPTLEETTAFLNDASPDAYHRLVERVLSDPHYGERWAQHWLDVVRYGDTDGFEVNTPRPNAWPYRDWVIRALNDDMPYTDFVFAQLAGDTVAADAATGFLVAGPALLEGQTGKDLLSQLQARQDELNEIVNTVGTAFMGLTIGCARCHNHKFDPIPQRDYYAMQAVLAGVRYGERPIRDKAVSIQKDRPPKVVALAEVERCLNELEPLARTSPGDTLRPAVTPRRNVERFAPMEARWVRFSIAGTNDGTEPCIDELEIYRTEAKSENVALASNGAKATASSTFRSDPQHQLAHVNDGRHGNARSWISAEPGTGWIQIELPSTTRIDHIVWSRDRPGRFSDRLPVRYQIEVATEPGDWKVIASSADRSPKNDAKPVFAPDQQREYEALTLRFQELYQAVHLQPQRPQVFAGKFGEPDATYRLYRGDPMQKRERMQPETLSIFHEQVGTLNLNELSPEQTRRAALAKWIVHPQNPLTPRVLVNRLWQHHFGVGLVDTPSDFGSNGSKPTHPELLDFLAEYFVKSGWSVKSVQRLILTSSTYRQSSHPRSEALRVDGESRLLWRFPPRRLEAEIIRDRILATAGVLDTRMGGPGFLVFKPNDNYVRVYDPKDTWDRRDWRRMVYAHKVRMAQDGVFGAFDCPDAGLPAPKRPRSTNAMQALNLFNSTFILQQAELFARRVESEAGSAGAAQLDHAFGLAFQRQPTAVEREACMRVLKEHGLAAVCRAIFNTNEFLFME